MKNQLSLINQFFHNKNTFTTKHFALPREYLFAKKKKISDETMF